MPEENKEDKVDYTVDEEGGPVDLTVEPEGTEIGGSISSSEEKKPEEESAEKPDANASDPDDLEEYGDKVRKRISKMTAKLRESERREKAALDYAQGVQTQFVDLQKKAQSVDNNYVTEFENRLTAQEGNLKADLHKAIESGDVSKQAEVQQALAKHAVETEKLNYAKTQVVTPEQQQVQQQTQQQQEIPVAPVAPAVPAPPSERASKWADENKWFGSDEPMTLTAFSIHKRLVESGVDPESDQYYNSLNTQIKTAFPHKFTQNTQGSVRNMGSPVATSSRVTSVSGKKSVKLSKSEVAIAHKLGVPLDQYAREVARLNS